MNITLNQPIFAEIVAAPTSKSAAHRMLIAAAFANAPTRMCLSGAGEDIAATCRVLTTFGAEIKVTDRENGQQTLDITPISAPAAAPIGDCGESGSTLRFLVPVAGALGLDATFLRRGRLPERPMTPLTAELARHGVQCCDNPDGSLSVCGQLAAGDFTLPADISSQYVTGLLFALSLLDGPSTLTLTGKIESAPYIDMTLQALAAFGAPPACEEGRIFRVAGRRAAPLTTPCELYPEGDFSGAAFPLAAGALGSHAVTVTGLDPNTAQGDRAILDLLARFGAEVKIDKGSATVSPAPLHGITVDAEQIPDLVPILAVIAAGAKGTTVIRGAARLRLKESDRIATTAAMLRALGADVTPTEDGLIVRGGKPLSGGTVDGAGDHRIVMSAAVAALLTDRRVVICGAKAVAKSYPRFFDDVITQGKEC